MSFFPTRILVATDGSEEAAPGPTAAAGPAQGPRSFPTRALVPPDGSEEAELAAPAAAELAKGTDSELHIVHVSELGAEISLNPAYSINRDLLEEPFQELERQGRHLLNGQVKKIEGAGDR